MGCDSHPCIEIKRKNGKWGLIDDKNRYYKLLDEGKDYDDVEKAKPSFIRVLGNRNYTLFAALADVRNRGSYIQPLFPNRGFPEDVSAATKKEIPEDSDYHSHTYFTVQELIDAPWDEIGCQANEIILYADQFQKWKETGELPEGDDLDELPYEADSFTRAVSEHEMTLLLMAEPAKKLAKKGRRQGRKYSTRYGPYVKTTVPLTYKQLIPQLYECLDDLKKLGDPESVRVVIAFDN